MARTTASARTINSGRTIASTRAVWGSTPPPVEGDAPTFVSAEVGNFNPFVVVITFSDFISQYFDIPNHRPFNAKTGMTVNVGGSPVTIDDGHIWDDGKVYLSLQVPIENGDTVTVAYSAITGHAVGPTGIPVATFSAQAVTNNVAAHAHTYYVATDGDDGAAGTIGAPFLTIQHAVDVAVASDLVYIRGGTYAEWVRLNSGNGGGTSGHYVVYMAYPTELPIIDGTGFDVGYSNNAIFDLGSSAYVRVSGIKVINSNHSGISSSYGGHVVYDNCQTDTTQNSGLATWYTDYVFMTDNNVDNACCAGAEECITSNGGNYIEISYNEVHDGGSQYGWTGGQGINLKTGANHSVVHHNLVYNLNQYGFGVDCWNAHTFDVRIYDNVAHDVADGFILESEHGGEGNDLWVYNNIAYDCLYDGLGAPPWGEAYAGYVHDIYFVNNTVYSCQYGFWGRTTHANSTNIFVLNNIFSQNTNNPQIVLASGTSGKYTIDSTLFYGNTNAPLGTNDVIGDPKFTDPVTTRNFHIATDSAGKTLGSVVYAPADDYDDVARGAAIDIGAYEYV